MISTLCRWIAWPALAAVVVVTLSPIAWRPMTGAPAEIERFAAFAVLGAVFCAGYPKHRIVVLVLLVAFVGSLEALQLLVPSRHARIYDAIVKAAGAGTGVFVAGRLTMRCPGLFRRDV